MIGVVGIEVYRPLQVSGGGVPAGDPQKPATQKRPRKEPGGAGEALDLKVPRAQDVVCAVVPGVQGQRPSCFVVNDPRESNPLASRSGPGEATQRQGEHEVPVGTG